MTTEKVVNTLCDAGFETYIVGGAVRDLFLGREPEDIDLATKALPEEILNLFPEGDVFTISRDKGVLMVKDIEVATFRSDTYFGGGKNDCKVELVQTIEEDLWRRDFTINSIAMCPRTGDIIDPCGGRQDLKNKIIRFVGDPEKRIWESPDRILRLALYQARTDFKVEKETQAAARRNASKVKELVPRELIQKILFKALKLQDASKFFLNLFELDLLQDIFPSLYKCYGFDGGVYHDEDVFTHCMLAGDHIHPKYPIIKLAAYLHDVGKPSTFDGTHFLHHEVVGAKLAEKDLRNLRLNLEDIRTITGLIVCHMNKMHMPTPRARRRLLARLETHGLNPLDWMRMKIADRVGNTAKANDTFANLIKAWRKYAALNEVPLTTDSIALNGKEIMDHLGLTPSKVVGLFKTALFEYILDHGEEHNSRESLLAVLPKVTDELLEKYPCLNFILPQ
jgi:tRNA nucleotidyltransferase (CCA-adding enzyme)